MWVTHLASGCARPWGECSMLKIHSWLHNGKRESCLPVICSHYEEFCVTPLLTTVRVVRIVSGVEGLRVGARRTISCGESRRGQLALVE
ncbi:hypothetical protein TNCT_285631 [Trichonephila clavata]|uniref:Uncharacterized protein n=1 Tax=Trichonephila clavata TaxID=2740835 RepID=A0A8X6GNB1_TRICU|nr:hypothetical protein TNCT_285631 [Trichonephila clavata]